jgi:2-oxoglutarate dehydrogenase E2 component (dihydrolipoamide succinyltransferase)
LSTAALRAPADSGAPASALRAGGASAPPPRAAAAAAAWRRGLRAAPPAAATVRVAVPSMGESITEGTVAAILKHPGDAVVEDDVLAQLETDKVTMDVKYQGSAPGVVSKIMAAEGDSVAVGQAFAEIDTDAAAAAATAPAPAEPAAAPAAEKKGKKEAAPTAAPAAAAPPPPPKPAAKPAAPAPAPPAPAAAGERPERRVKMTRLRSRIAQRLKGAQNTYAMLTTFNEVDMTELMALRAAHKDAFLERHGVKLGFMSAFVRAAADALAAVPSVNGVIDGDEIVYRDYVDISVAVSTPKGLVVPVLRGADRMSFADVERTINELGRKARDGALSIDEMAGGTFTISNGGVFGSLLSTPIINPPQSAILGMHATNMRPAVVGGVVVPRPLMYLALTYDHRLVDGREAVTFLKRVKEVVEDPRRLLLDV